MDISNGILTVITIAGVSSIFAVFSSRLSAEDPDDALLKKAQRFFKPLPGEIPAPADNPTTPEKVELGKMLYYDPRLSLSGFISCNSCHNIATFGVDNEETSIGHKWQLGPRKAPTVLNAGFHITQFWDGRAKDLEEQAKAPILNPVEMAIPDSMFAVKRLRTIPEYARTLPVLPPSSSETPRPVVK